MQYLAIPLSILALAFLFHGFPSINIGNKNYYYYNEEDEEC
jgi:hypothetical protein